MWVQISYFYTQQNEPELHNQLTGLGSDRQGKKMLEGDPGGGVRRWLAIQWTPDSTEAGSIPPGVQEPPPSVSA